MFIYAKSQMIPATYFFQKERIEEYNNTIENNPCIQELKVDFENDNKNHIFDQRMNVLKSGSYFPKLPEKVNKV